MRRSRPQPPHTIEIPVPSHLADGGCAARSKAVLGKQIAMEVSTSGTSSGRGIWIRAITLLSLRRGATKKERGACFP